MCGTCKLSGTTSLLAVLSSTVPTHNQTRSTIPSTLTSLQPIENWRKRVGTRLYQHGEDNVSVASAQLYGEVIMQVSWEETWRKCWRT